VDIEWAMFINTNINEELLTVTFFLEGLAAMRAFKDELFEVSVIRAESRITNFALKLASTACIIVDIFGGCITDRTYSTLWGDIFSSMFNRFKRFTVFFKVLIQ